jgi:asparagine synthase (glutamine-hydrolysing)
LRLAIDYDRLALRLRRKSISFSAYSPSSRSDLAGLSEAEAGMVFCDKRLHGLALESFRQEISQTKHYPDDRRAEYFYINQHDRRSTHNMVTFSRSAIEVACPFFDYDVVEFIYSLPLHIRATPAFYRAVITRRLSRLATVPYDKDDRLPHRNPLIRHPHAVMQRAKRRINRYFPALFPDRPRLYADYEKYLRTDLREWAERILFDGRTLDRGLFNPEVVRDLWTHHLSGTELWTIGKIAPLITIELVLRLLSDDPPGA